MRVAFLSSLLIIGLLVLGVLFLSPKHGWEKKSWIESPKRISELASVPNALNNWPPKLNQVFPSVALFDHDGKKFDFSQLRGKPTLVEFIAMTCAACQAGSGAHSRGVFDDLAAQDDLEGIEEYYRRFTGGGDLFDGSVNFVQLVIYDTSLRPPRAEHLAAWREHFGFDKKPNTFIVSGGEALANRDSFNRIPGFLLLDKQGTVRYDALGHQPKHNLYTELLPAVPGLK